MTESAYKELYSNVELRGYVRGVALKFARHEKPDEAEDFELEAWIRIWERGDGSVRNAKDHARKEVNRVYKQRYRHRDLEFPEPVKAGDIFTLDALWQNANHYA